MTLLEIEHLSKRFAGRRTAAGLLRGRVRPVVRALEDVSFEVGRGEALGIVGESGCGKSTLARCLVRLHEPDTGAVRFEGSDVLVLSAAARRRYNRQVQMVFQDPYGSLNPRMTAGQVLAEALAVHRIVRPSLVASRVRELLDIVHLPPDSAERYPHEFSGGQRQRVGIARALSVEPTVLIADEPVSALDVSVQAQIVNLLLELQQRLGLTLIFITHDLRLVKHLSHRIAVMYLGRIVEIGSTAELFTTPRHPYTQALIRAAPQVRPGRRTVEDAIRGELPSPLAPPPGCAFHPRCPIAEPRCAREAPVLDQRGGPWPVACHLAGSRSIV
jgi:oligopeptide/dipeptide ABC transporter ATP-binding protein